jgi:Ca2+-binding EF-hand superfamily protein
MNKQLLSSAFIIIFISLCSAQIKSEESRKNTESLLKFFDVKKTQNIFNDFQQFQLKFAEPKEEEWKKKAAEFPELWKGVMDYFGVAKTSSVEEDIQELDSLVTPELVVSRMVLHIYAEYDLNNDNLLSQDEFTSFMYDTMNHFKKNHTASLKEIQGIYQTINKENVGITAEQFVKFYLNQ